MRIDHFESWSGARYTFLYGQAVQRMQVDDTEVINFLLTTEIIPLCLRTMEMGSELSKTVATFIVQKILLDDVSPLLIKLGSCSWSFLQVTCPLLEPNCIHI